MNLSNSANERFRPTQDQKGDDRLRKRLWRLYGRTLGLPESIVTKPKKAMQYSMGIHQVVFRMVKREEIDLGSHER